MTNYRNFSGALHWQPSPLVSAFALLPSLQADDWNKKTTLTVTEPIASAVLLHARTTP